MVVFEFCMRGLRVLWPKHFEGNQRYANGIFKVMIMAHGLFLLVKIVQADSDSYFMEVISLMTVRLCIWNVPWLALRPPESEGFFSRRFPFLRHITPYINLIWIVYLAIFEVTRSPDMPNVPGLYRSLFLCGILVALWRAFSAIIPPSWRNWSTSALGAAYGNIRSAGSEAREYVLSIHHRVRSVGWEAWAFVLGVYDRIRDTGS
ncbi:hypothetical protein DFH94DRAFT_777309 [Russula ochroleuca]|uniref:Uncharacterized protein n=1 Tax=Russula ochroleuca TaxID=152965 RepID=A0A9P5JWR8_9AGAM|nr:hypothetical protein DFH94DRAFT_777309 [Russula ochroleuca]